MWTAMSIKPGRPRYHGGRILIPPVATSIIRHGSSGAKQAQNRRKTVANESNDSAYRRAINHCTAWQHEEQLITINQTTYTDSACSCTWQQTSIR